MEIKDFSKLALNEITNTTLMSDKDFKSITAILPELVRSYEVRQIWRTESEARYSVLNDLKFPTPASKYWQSNREQSVYFTQLIYLICNYQETEGLLELEEIKLDEIKTNTKYDQAMKKIITAKINQLKFKLTDMKLQSHDRVRELLMWEKLKNEQTQKADFSISDPNKHQKESYEKRWELENEIAKLSNNTALFKNSKANLDTLRNHET